MRVTSITQIKTGQKIKAKHKSNKQKLRGEVKSIDYGRGIFIVEQSNGEQKVVDILKFIVDILPLVDAILFWVGQKFSRLFKKKNRGI